MVKCGEECVYIGEMACPNNTLDGGACFNRVMKACEIIGESEVIAIAERLVHARTKHPDNGGSRRGSFDAIEDEGGELMIAFFDESEDRQDDEALDVVVTCLRFRGKEYDQPGGE